MWLGMKMKFLFEKPKRPANENLNVTTATELFK